MNNPLHALSRRSLPARVAAGLVLLVFTAATTADETCMSPYMAKIVGQEDYVYVWTLGVPGLGDEQDKLVTVDVAVTAVSSTLEKLGVEPEDAQDAAEALARAGHQVDLAADKPLPVLAELVQDVPEDLKRKVLSTANFRTVLGFR